MKSSKLIAAAALLAGISPATASDTAPLNFPIAMELPHLVQSLVGSMAFGLVGILLAIAGFKLFDLAIPFDLEKEMCENKNVAVGILSAAIVLGVCHIIAASMS